MSAEFFLTNMQTVIDEQIEAMDLSEMDALANKLFRMTQQHSRFHFSGVGKSSQVALYMSSLYSSIGFPSYYLDATEAIHGSAGQVQNDDVVFLISNSGETEELIKTAETLKENGAYLITVNRNPHSELSLLCHDALIAYAKHEGDPLNKPPRASVLCQMIVLQTLSVMLQELKNLDMATYVKWHPAGKIGKSIKDAL